jgi:hypothetical protein
VVVIHVFVVPHRTQLTNKTSSVMYRGVHIYAFFKISFSVIVSRL